MCYFLGKCSDDPENIDWIPTTFNYKQARTKFDIIKVDQRRKDTKVYVKNSYNSKWYIIFKFE